MKKNIILSASLVLLAMLASCEKEDAVNNERSLLPTRSETEIIPMSEVEKYITGNYYSIQSTFCCSDSLDKVCYWNLNGESTFDVPSASSSYNILTSLYGEGYSLYKFEAENKAVEYCSSYAAIASENTDHAYQWYWYYLEKTGHFLISYRSNELSELEAYAEKQDTGWKRLIGIDENYIVIREEGAGQDRFNQGHSTYQLHVYVKISDPELIATRWCTSEEPVPLPAE